VGVIFSVEMNTIWLAEGSWRARNIDFQFQCVRLAGLQPADWGAAENTSTGHTGLRPMFRPAHHTVLFISSETKHPASSIHYGC
jgi:hypothetical protein